MKRLAVLLAGLTMGGCSSEGSSDYSVYYQVLRSSFHRSLSGGAVSMAEAAAVPYSSMGLRIGDDAESLIVLASDTNGDALWTSKAHIVLLTHDGRVRRTVGLEHDLTALAPQNSAELPAPAAALKAPVNYVMRADFADMGIYATPIACRLAVARHETVTILGHAMATVRVDERCQSTPLKWAFVNSYWIDADSGFVWRSRQSVHPKGNILRTEIFRPSE